MGWTIVVDDSALTAALALAKGDYQRALLNGSEALSGSTLKGKAAKYGSQYAKSRRALLQRMTSAGIKWAVARGNHGKKFLVLGGDAVTAAVRLGAKPDAIRELAEMERAPS